MVSNQIFITRSIYRVNWGVSYRVPIFYKEDKMLSFFSNALKIAQNSNEIVFIVFLIIIYSLNILLIPFKILHFYLYLNISFIFIIENIFIFLSHFNSGFVYS